MRWLLLRKVPVLIASFHASLLHARKLLSRIQPISVLSCDNGSENLHVKAFAYLCLRRGVRFYRYKPVPAFPVRQPAFNSVSRFMLVTPDDAQIFRDNGAVPEVWNVGSPILDLAAPFVRKDRLEPSPRNGHSPEKISILFCTKRDFSNRGVISAISDYCVQRRQPAELTVKFHPSDAKEFALEPPDSGGLVKIVYYGREEIEHVDRLIFESDIVVSGSSNVIWSAFAQFKPVVYLAFKGMSSEMHVSGYGQYATSDFLVASELEEIGDIIGRLADGTGNGGFPKNLERHKSLMRSFFCSGEFNSRERISRILSGRV